MLSNIISSFSARVLLLLISSSVVLDLLPGDSFGDTQPLVSLLPVS